MTKVFVLIEPNSFKHYYNQKEFFFRLKLNYAKNDKIEASKKPQNK